MNMSVSAYETAARQVAHRLLDRARLGRGGLLVVGCSTSEIAGSAIGTASSESAAEAVFAGVYGVLNGAGVALAAQCCEHLNRALILEREEALRRGYDVVNAVPRAGAGGSFAAAAYRHFRDPVAVEAIRADAGIDIGDTLIGMHLRPVAVPVRIEPDRIGMAHVVCARTRPKYIGGARAQYDPNLL